MGLVERSCSFQTNQSGFGWLNLTRCVMGCWYVVRRAALLTLRFLRSQNPLQSILKAEILGISESSDSMSQGEGPHYTKDPPRSDETVSFLPSYLSNTSIFQSAGCPNAGFGNSRYDICLFLAVARRLNIDFLPITWLGLLPNARI